MLNALSIDYKLLVTTNATPHTNNIYADEVSSVRQTRRNSNDYVLSNPDVSEKIQFETDCILSCYSRHNMGVDFGDLRLGLPKIREIPKFHESLLSSDVIFVSREYAYAFRDYARSDADFDLMDRFFIDGTKVLGINAKGNWGQIGTTYLEKFVYPNGGKNIYAYPYYGDNRYGFREMKGYIEAYENGRRPSLAAVLMLLNYLQVYDSSITRSPYYMDLYFRAISDIQSRESVHNAQMPIIYNV